MCDGRELEKFDAGVVGGYTLGIQILLGGDEIEGTLIHHLVLGVELLDTPFLGDLYGGVCLGGNEYVLLHGYELLSDLADLLRLDLIDAHAVEEILKSSEPDEFLNVSVLVLDDDELGRDVIGLVFVGYVLCLSNCFISHNRG